MGKWQEPEWAKMRAVWLALLLMPLAGAEGTLVLEDPAGDVEMSSWGTGTAAVGPWEAVDLLGLAMEEDPDSLFVTIDVGGFPSCEGGQCINAGDVRTYFMHGEAGYYVQQGLDPLGAAYGRLHHWEGTPDGPVIDRALGAVKDIDETTVTVRVPRAYLIDESGAPPMRGSELTDIHTRSYSQFSLGGQDPRGGEDDDMLVTRDRMGFEDMGNFTFRLGGATSNGPISIQSDAPFRSSNGGAATYRYELTVSYDGQTETRLDFGITGLPAGWTFLRPNGTLNVLPGEHRDFAILIETPSSHQHGGSDTFDLRIEDVRDPDTWAQIELGVHYLTIPQPAGHHPSLFLHTLTDGLAAQALAAFGNDDGRIWMNTLEDDPGDENVGVVAQEGFGGFQAQRGVWSVCMIPNLRMGLDFDLDRLGEATFKIGSTAPYNQVTLTGELLHIEGREPLDFCAPQLYRNRESTVLATLGDGSPVDLLGSQSDVELVLTPTTESDVVPYSEGAQLVLEIVASYTGGDPTHDGIRLYEGRLDLPLVEYFDERPPGFVGGAGESINTTLDDLDVAPPAKKQTPLPVIVVMAAILLARVGKRPTTTID